MFFAAAVFSTNPSLANPQPTKNENPEWPTLLILGDSLSASFGIEQSQGWVSLLRQKITSGQYPMRVINASISGETTQGGLQRLPALLKKYNPKIVVVELGGNDGLRGLKLSMIKANLLSIIETIEYTDASILLVGVRLPPNYGQIYTGQFFKIYSDLATDKNISLVPFLLDGIATNGSLMQSDGIHPTAEAQPALLENIWKTLHPMIEERIVTSEN